MPILLYLPRSQGGPFKDATLAVSGLTKVVLSDRVTEPYIPTVFDGRLILCTHGSRQKPLVLVDRGRWITAAEFVQKYSAHFQYLKAHLTRIDLFMCHAGQSGFGEAFAEQMRHLLEGDHVTIAAPTAQFTILENEKKWRVGVGNALPYIIGLSRLFLLGKFDRYDNPFCTMAWAGYPRPRPGFTSTRVWTALGGDPVNRPAYQACQWSAFGFRQFSVTPTARDQKRPPVSALGAPERPLTPGSLPSR